MTTPTTTSRDRARMHIEVRTDFACPARYLAVNPGSTTALGVPADCVEMVLSGEE